MLEVAYRLRCPDPEVILSLPSETLDAWVWFLNDRTDRIQTALEHEAARGAPPCASSQLARLLDD